MIKSTCKKDSKGTYESRGLGSVQETGVDGVLYIF